MTVEVTAKFNHEWTTEHKFIQDVTVDEIPAHSVAWITLRAG